jgi:ankyrin repeat protein
MEMGMEIFLCDIKNPPNTIFMKHQTPKFKVIIALVIGLMGFHLSYSQSPDDLIKAITAGEVEKAMTMIPTADVNYVDKDGNSALSIAAMWYPELTKTLLDAKADVNQAGKTGMTPLFGACRWGNPESVKLLIDAGADVNKESIAGSPLLISFNYSSAPIVKMLLDAGAKFNDPVKLAGTVTVYPFLQYIKTVKTPDEMVAYYGSNKEAWMKMPIKFPDRVLNPKAADFSPAADVVKVFLDKGLDINKVYESNKVKETALDAAMQAGLVEAAKVIMDAGAKFDIEKPISIRDRSNNQNALFPNITYTNGDYVLGAVMSDKFEFVKYMVEKFPKLVSKSYEGKGSVRCSDSNSGGKKDQTYSVKGIDLLMVAAEHGNADIVKFLIEKGAGKGKIAEAEWTGVHDKKLMCVFLNVRWTMSFAKNSGNQDVIAMVKAAGHSKEN